MKKIRAGIAGVVGRGQIYVKPMLHHRDDVEIVALCDLKEEGMKKYADMIGGNVKCFTSYEEMIDSGLCNLVIVATPMHCHVPQSIYALERDINVVCEVAAATTIEECRELYRAVKKSKAQYMMAENAGYQKELMIIDGMIKAGLFGEVHYAEGQYLHELPFRGYKSWRDHELMGANYCTHPLGPMLQWFDNERIVKICCVGSGRHPVYEGVVGKREKANVMLCKTESGRLLQVRIDLDSKAPYQTPYELDGELGRAIVEKMSPTSENKIHLEHPDFDHTHYAEEWKTLEYYEQKFLPESWKEATHKIPNQGHDRCDYVMVLEIIKALVEGRKLPIDIDMAMNMTLPGILSIESIEKGGEWIDVPDLSKEV